MASKRFFIGPYTEGMQNNIRPFLLPDNAFSSMNNAYVYRGRVRKRFGSRLINQSLDLPQLASRFRIKMPVQTDGVGNTVATLIPGSAAYHATLGKMFSINDYVYLVYQNGAMRTNDPANNATYNTATGQYQFTGAPALADIYYYPGHPVMGLLTFETEATNQEQLIGFDTEFSYKYSATGWVQLDAALATWTGDDAEFFWGTTWRGANEGDTRFFVSNYNAADGIRYWDNTTWTTLAYVPTAGAVINTARIIIPFQRRLLLLNTKETIGGNTTTHQNRIRWSIVGNPLDPAVAFFEESEKGGYFDLSTKEAIVSARIVHNHLIIFCERSTWQLAYTNNAVDPFVPIKIDSELGAESPFASVLFDKDIVGVGNVGIHACNGSYVQRIDEKIPEEVFEIHNGNSGPERVYGIRDYQTEMIYWTFPNADKDPTYPNKVLTYSYVSKTWAFNDDTITAFGYYQPTNDITWAEITKTWEDYEGTWGNASLQSFSRTIIAGNQQGFTFLLDAGLATNAPALQITEITIPDRVRLMVMNHNLQNSDFIRITGCQGDITLNSNIYKVIVHDENNIEIIDPEYALPYLGGGLISRVSRIDIKTKNFNFFSKEGYNFQINKVNMLVDRTTEGKLTVDFIPSYSNLVVDSLLLETSPYGAYPLEGSQMQVWHALYPNAEGSGVMMRIYTSDEQMVDRGVNMSDFQLNAMMISATPTSARLQ